ncbi:NRAMP family divalent metal transporter [Halostreptopolyspora alba]|uniref:Divalent metal cation transporter n=1 Tax=Halostreptopolyspora alba TaxID=2487137 RepID=A0A3N0EB50_9ACTN|nr:divalent metal cation transporter [Nocardiopsaceae bacterium YIM 96095]
MSERDDTRARPSLGAAAGRGTLLGAMFLMATSAVGPGFITQTTEFTARLGAVFAFAILVSIAVDIAVQLNIWRVVGVSGERAQDLANRVVPGAGYLLAVLIVVGGLVFNIGNIGGTALGLDALAGLDVRIGGTVSAAIAIGIFLVRRAGVAIDRIIVVLGAAMIALTCYVAVVSRPPVGEAMRQAVLPEALGSDVFFATVTIIGGTVGGYITYAGAHRLIDSGTKGPENVGTITRASVTGVLLTGVMRVLLFLAVLGVVTGGTAVLDTANPPAAAFQSAAGEVGMRLFGVIMWTAGISSVIGASYTSISFVTSFSERLQRHRGWLVAGFITVSAVVYALVQQTPTTLLIFAGALNGLILPVGLGVMLWVAAFRGRDLLGGYRYPRWLLALGVLAWLLTVVISYRALSEIPALWQ